MVWGASSRSRERPTTGRRRLAVKAFDRSRRLPPVLCKDYNAEDSVLRAAGDIPERICPPSVGDGNIHLPNSGPPKKVLPRP
jgi:hypothetical protein